jgi:riboflavin synthase
MFTGIVEGLGTVVRARRSGRHVRLGIDPGSAGEGVAIGDSIAVDGICLTVAADGSATVPGRKRARAGAPRGTSVLEFDLVRETLERTTAAQWRPGHRVNLERSLRLADRIGGHLVTGHVDGVGTVTGVERQRGQTWLTVELPGELASGVLFKGSIAILGVSLTIAAVRGARVSAALIPHTLETTSLGTCRPGDRVNVETDLIGKWVRHLLPLSREKEAVRRSRRELP